MNHHSITASIAVYQTRLSNLIDRAASIYQGSATYDGRTVYQKQNVGSAVLKGIEGEVEFSIMPMVRGWGNMTYTHGTNTTASEPMRRVPPLFAKTGVIFNKKNGGRPVRFHLRASKQDFLRAIVRM